MISVDIHTDFFYDIFNMIEIGLCHRVEYEKRLILRR